MGGISYLDFLAKFGVGGAHPGGILLTKDILSQEEISNNMLILDAGCGTGQTAAHIYKEYGAKVVGLEINPIMLEKAKDRFHSQKLPIELVEGSIELLPFEDNTFDFILSESVLVFVDKPKALKEFFRVLKKGGRFIANEMTINTELNIQDELEIKEFYAIDSLLREEDWKELLEKTGFRMIQLKEEKQSLSTGNNTPEFNFSTNFEPALFNILNQHGNMIIKYHEILSNRIITCSK